MNELVKDRRPRVRIHRRRRPIRRRRNTSDQRRNPLAEVLNAASGTFIAYGVARFISAIASLIERTSDE